MTASAVNVLTADLSPGPGGDVQRFAVAVAAMLDPTEGYPAPIMLAEDGWTILAEESVWVEDLDPDPGDPKAGRWRWAGIVGCTRTITGTETDVPILQAVGHWDIHGLPTVTSRAGDDGSTVGYVAGGAPDSGTAPDDLWDWTSITHGVTVVAAGATVGPFTVTPIPFTTAGATLAIGSGAAGPGDDGEVLVDSASLDVRCAVSGSYSGSFGTFRPGYGPVLWTAGSGRSWTMGSLDAYDTTLGITEIPVAWWRGRFTQAQFFEPWSPPEPPATGGLTRGLRIGAARGLCLAG